MGDGQALWENVLDYPLPDKQGMRGGLQGELLGWPKGNGSEKVASVRYKLTEPASDAWWAQKPK